MKFNSILAALVVGCAVMACKKSPKVITLENGVVVTFIEEGEKIDSVLQEDKVVFVNLIYTLEDGTELFNTPKLETPIPFLYKKTDWDKGGLFFDVMEILNVGDSVTFSIGTEDFYNNTIKVPQIPDSVAASPTLKFMIGVDTITDREGYTAIMKEYSDKRSAKKLTEEKDVIEKYAADNGLELTYTESGLGYVITEQGSGDMPNAGDKIVANYSGFLLDGTKFDSSLDRNEPFSFTLGQGQVIKGWDEGFALLNPGSKAVLLIPSPLGYGDRGAGGQIPPNSVLKFDVELIEIQNQSNE